MKNERKIIGIDKLDDYEIHLALKEGITEFEWRIQAKKYKELFVEVCNDIVGGIGISWTNSNHPTAKYIHVISDIAGNNLMEKLLHNNSPHTKVIFSCWEDEKDKILLIHQFNFKLFRKTFMERYDVDFLVQKLQTTDSIPAFLSLQQILNNPLLEKDLFQLLKHNYEQTHLHNPAKEVGWQTWKDNLMEDEIDLDLSYIAIDNGRVSAYIFVHPINQDHYEIGWVGKRNNFNLTSILKKQLIQLAHNGVKTVEFEIDTTDYNAYQFANILDLDSKRSWNSYILENT
ncbi:hypothetical protein CSE16_13120 [Solibacillus sp. R5-41]|uniref:hypothetical protein n=1 Tax=Solibacillus sp. R5-41 TaxID=2048654 RepID=UPI000C125EF1|nr:hypothetical protein [Solibacillus sp. R5-41]ATP40913.1 hypothetical protein CSE16_13120 [Solibacillus sp. R5-41]